MDDTQLRHQASEIERRVGDELFSHQQLTRAAAAYERSLTLDKNNIKTLNNFGALYEKLGDAGKMMALAGLGNNSQTSRDEQHMLDYLIASSSPIDTFSKSDFVGSKYYNIGPHSQPFCDLAKKISNALFEHIRLKILPHINKKIPLLISGGCGLNCDWNRKWA